MELAGTVLIILGAFFMLVSALGIWRMPDFYTRLHPAGIGDDLGLPLVIMGAALHLPLGLVTAKLLLLLLVAMITGATACHALAKSALISGLKPEGKISEEDIEDHVTVKSGRKRSYEGKIKGK